MSETEDICHFVEKLLEWWLTSGGTRNYPWRREKNPYKILIAEILLQRTRRDKVIEVYSKFINRFPSPEILANASLEEVEKVIKPLGLRKRAKYLIRLAQAMISEHDILKKYLFEKLPGVGDYIASTVKLILGVDVKLKADVSIARLFSRYYGKPLNNRRPADTHWVNEYLNTCAPDDPNKKKEYFLALIDLAWEICKPRTPLCSKCPLKEQCSYYRSMQY